VAAAGLRYASPLRPHTVGPKERKKKMEADHAGHDRPAKVTWAVKLLYLSFYIGIIRAIMMFTSLHKANSRFFAVVVLAAVLYFSWLMIFKMDKGKNWARRTYAALFLAGLPFIKPSLFTSFTANLIPSGIAIIQLLLQVVALVLLYQKESAEWYKQMKTDAEPRP
jgi:K+ transporter